MKSESTSQYLALKGVDLKTIHEPDLDSPSQNHQRWQALGRRQGVLTKVPPKTRWWLGMIDGEELCELLADEYCTWQTLSRGTQKLLRVAQAVHNAEEFASDKPNVQAELPKQINVIKKIYRSLDRGTELEPIILVRAEEGGPLTVIEGMKRATALCWRHCLDNVPCLGVDVLIGIMPAVG